MKSDLTKLFLWLL